MLSYTYRRLFEPAIEALVKAINFHKDHPLTSPVYPQPFVWTSDDRYFPILWHENSSCYIGDNLFEFIELSRNGTKSQVYTSEITPKLGVELLAIYSQWLLSFKEILSKLGAAYFGFRIAYSDHLSYYVVDLKNQEIYYCNLPDRLLIVDDSSTSCISLPELLTSAEFGILPPEESVAKLLSESFYRQLGSECPDPFRNSKSNNGLTTYRSLRNGFIVRQATGIALSHLEVIDRLSPKGKVRIERVVGKELPRQLYARLFRTVAYGNNGRTVLSYIPDSDLLFAATNVEASVQLVTAVLERFIPVSAKAGLDVLLVSYPIITQIESSDIVTIGGSVVSCYFYNSKTETMRWLLDIEALTPNKGLHNSISLSENSVALNFDSEDRMLSKLSNLDLLATIEAQIFSYPSYLHRDFDPVYTFYELFMLGYSRDSYIDEFANRTQSTIFFQWDPLLSSVKPTSYKRKFYKLVNEIVSNK